MAAVLFALILRRLGGSRQAVPSLEWWENFSLERYRPLERLASEQDYDFLKQQPGFRPAMLKKLRRQRRTVAGQYLRLLSRDFDRLHLFAQQALLHSAVDRPDLTLALLKQRWMFLCAVGSIRLRLALPGLHLGAADLARLVRVVEGMRHEVRLSVRLAVVTEPAA